MAGSVHYNMFHYSDYWHTWSRVLRFDPAKTRIVEVNVTPINAWVGENWEKDILPIKIREHGTTDRYSPSIWKARGERMGVTFDYRDGLWLSESLPDEVLKELNDRFGNDFLQRLLKEDFYSAIDWDKYRIESQLGGGAPFDLVRK